MNMIFMYYCFSINDSFIHHLEPEENLDYSHPDQDADKGKHNFLIDKKV